MSFKITGRIEEAESGLGVTGLFIKAVDKDLLYDDLLGGTFSDSEGKFEVLYDDEDFHELLEGQPDIYVVVKTPDRLRVLYSSEKQIRYEAGTEEHFTIRIPRETLGDFAPGFDTGTERRSSTMAQVILFGGGDGGGLIIGPNGVRPIPPFDPSIRFQLRGLSALLNGIIRIPEKPRREMGKLVNRVSNLVVEQVEAVVGRLEGENSLIYQDDDGGFTCGSTGKPPIPLKWPPLQSPSFSDLLASGVVEHDLVDFVNEASAKKINLTDILEKPAEVAGRLGRQLSERTIQDLQLLAPSRLQKINDPVEREVIQFFHKVADDGRFVSTWASRPMEAANALKVQLSDKAFERIVAGGSSTIFDPGISSMPAVVVGVLVGVLIMLVTRDAEITRIPIKDRSGIVKF